MAFANGDMPASLLVKTSVGPELRSDAAASFERMAPVFCAGVGHALLLSDGYRAKAGPFGQVAIFESRYTSLTSLGVADRRGPWQRTDRPSLGPRYWWRRPGTAAAAVPGTSNHGTGIAADFASGVNSASTAAHRWMLANAGAYGWVWPAWARRAPSYEPWHWEYHPELDQHKNDAAQPAPETETQEETMLVLAKTPTSPDVWIGDGITRRKIGTLDTLKAQRWLAARQILGPFYQGGEVQTIPDLYAIGYPIDVAIEQKRS